MTKKPTEVMAAIVDLLSPLASEDRQRVIQAALLLLGESAVPAVAKAKFEAGENSDDEDWGLPAKARTWAKQNGLTQDMLEQVFHSKAGVFEVIAEPPGKSQREKTINAYLLTGIAKFLASGESTFDDQSARDLCTTSGCYSVTNHATYLKDRGNDFTGNRDTGWSLTSPGLKHSALIIKGLSVSGE
jgi:hypothetical protein